MWLLLALAFLPGARATAWSVRHAEQLKAIHRKFSPPPPPPMDEWSAPFVAAAATAAGLNGDKFSEHDVDGPALHELERNYALTGTMPALVDTAGEKTGPKLKFLRLLRAWAAKADAPMPSGPPPPSPPPFAPPGEGAIALEVPSREHPASFV